MIKLDKGLPPPYLDEEKVKELTQKFKDTGAAVWRDDESIKEYLLRESYSKCAYCESSIDRAGAGLEVEHFYPKNFHPDKVITWSNLLASCRRCNTKKSFTTNSITQDIINPFEDHPKDHLSYEHGTYRLCAKTDLGFNTIKKLDLNNRKLLVRARFEVSDEINEKLLTLNISHADDLLLRNLVSDVLELCLPEAEFSAITAHALHANGKYKSMKQHLENVGLWDDEMQRMHEVSLSILLN